MWLRQGRSVAFARDDDLKRSLLTRQAGLAKRHDDVGFGEVTSSQRDS